MINEKGKPVQLFSLLAVRQFMFILLKTEAEKLVSPVANFSVKAGIFLMQNDDRSCST